jgi:hypothetical protein
MTPVDGRRINAIILGVSACVAVLLLASLLSRRGVRRGVRGSFASSTSSSSSGEKWASLHEVLAAHHEPGHPQASLFVGGTSILQLSGGACVSRASEFTTMIASPAINATQEIVCGGNEVVNGKRLSADGLNKCIQVQALPTRGEAIWHPNPGFLLGIQPDNVIWEGYFQLHNLYHTIDCLDGLPARMSVALAAAQARVAAGGRVDGKLALVAVEEKVQRGIRIREGSDAVFGNMLRSSLFGFSDFISPTIDAGKWHCFPTVATPTYQRSPSTSMLNTITETRPVPTLNTRSEWIARLGLSGALRNKATASGGASNDSGRADAAPYVVILERRGNRHIVNLKFVQQRMQELGWAVRVLYPEDLTLDEQFAGIHNATTLVAAHGAALRWGQFLHPSAALVQLVGFPCALETQSPMGYQRRYAVVRSALRAMEADPDEDSARRWCALLATHPRGAEKTSPPLAPSDAALLARYDRDVRHYDMIVDVPDLLSAVRRLDPTLDPEVPATSLDGLYPYQLFKPAIDSNHLRGR